MSGASARPLSRRLSRSLARAMSSNGILSAVDNTLIVYGDSRVSQTYNDNALRVEGFAMWARQALKGRVDFDKTRVHNHSGQGTNTLATTHLASATSEIGGSALLMMGTNDLGALTLAQSTANIDTIIAAFRAAGKIVFICDEYPRVSVPGTTPQLIGIRDHIRGRHNPSAGIYVMPTWDAVADVPDGTAPKTGYLSDGTHLSNRGAEAAGFACADAMRPYLPAVNLLTRPGIVNEQLFASGGGSITGAAAGIASGTVPSGWTMAVDEGTGGSVVSSIQTDLYGDGINWWQIVVAGVTRISATLSTGDVSAAGTLIVPDVDKIDAHVLYQVDAGPENLSKVKLAMFKQSGIQIPGAAAASDGNYFGSVTTDFFSPDAIDAMLRLPHTKNDADATQLRWRLELFSPSSVVANFTVRFALPQLRVYEGILGI